MGVRRYVCVYVHAHTHTHTHRYQHSTQILTHIHIHIHTHTAISTVHKSSDSVVLTILKSITSPVPGSVYTLWIRLPGSSVFQGAGVGVVCDDCADCYKKVRCVA